MNAKATEKVLSVDVMPTIWSKGNLYLLVLYVQSISKTRGKARNISPEVGCDQNKSFTQSLSSLRLNSMYSYSCNLANRYCI
ncbi:hypothetical protein RHMOL_Rhmol03G0096100 [Rhododendron molle]|uniref:Uncharacterized protein n=1 Tax=Rhododendron molle TaxID=49168 RepID=A0ACC0PCK6_RHOML|nr:hypothetical protein RHMOL_Rhmol03G0096100 [Rhododendron molle]